MKSNYTIEPIGDGAYALYEHGTYGRGSVLEGQPRRSFVRGFNTKEDAVAAHPDVEALDHSTKVRYNMLTSNPTLMPPSWFDPDAAGEEW